MKETFKMSFLVIINSVFGFVCSYIFPLLWLVAFNRLKGNSVNTDGELFVPFGWIMIFLIPVLFFVINFFIIKKYFSGNKFLAVFAISVLAFIIGAIIAVAIWPPDSYVKALENGVR